MSILSHQLGLGTLPVTSTKISIQCNSSGPYSTYYCMNCGSWGNSPCMCKNFIPQVPTVYPSYPYTYPQASKKPHTCPKCNGNGTETGVSPYTHPTAVKCWPCQGSGIVWES